MKFGNVANTMSNWLAGLVGAVILASSVAWLTGALDAYTWPWARVQLALENYWSDDPQPFHGSFRIVLCWLEDDSGKDGKTVARAFTGVHGIELVRSERLVAAPGAAGDWLPAMQQSALAVMEARHADLAIVGLVKQSGESLSLWFVPRSGGGTLDRGDQTYRLEDVTLGPDFHDDLRTQLTATALAAVAPLANSEARGMVLEKGLEDAAEKLSVLLESPAVGNSEHRAALHAALGIALTTLSRHEISTARLEQAVHAHRSALVVFTVEDLPHYHKIAQDNPQIALLRLQARRAEPGSATAPD